jgi:hypothetical protein
MREKTMGIRLSRVFGLLGAGFLLLFLCSCPPGNDFDDQYLWSLDLGQAAVCAPVRYGDGSVLVLGFKGRFLCLKDDSGEILWSLGLPGRYVLPPQLDPSGAIFVQSADGGVHKVILEEGVPRIAWSYAPAPRTNREAICLGSQTILMANGLYGQAVLLDKENGQAILTIDLSALAGEESYNIDYTQRLHVSAADYSYLIGRRDGAYIFIREDGSVAGRRNFTPPPPEPPQDGTIAYNLEPIPQNGPLLARGPRVFGFFTQNSIPDPMDPLSMSTRFFLGELTPAGIGQRITLEDAPGAGSSSIYPEGCAMLDASTLVMTNYTEALCYNLDGPADAPATLVYRKNPLLDRGEEWVSWEATYFCQDGRIGFWYNFQTKLQNANLNRALYLHDPNIPDLGKPPSISVPKVQMISTPAIVPGYLILATTEGRVKAYALDTRGSLFKQEAFY